MNRLRPSLVWLLVAPLALSLSASGCAALVNGTHQEGVTLIGYPGQTAIKVTDASGAVVYDGPSPAHVTMHRSETYKMTVSRSGFAPETVAIDSHTNWWWLLPAFTFTGPFEIISFVNGSVQSFTDDGIEVTIFPDGRRPANAVAFEP